MALVKSPTRNKPDKVRLSLSTPELLEDDSFFGTPEEIARDNSEWDAIVASTPPEKLKALRRKFDEEIKRGGISPLDFTDK